MTLVIQGPSESSPYGLPGYYRVCWDQNPLANNYAFYVKEPDWEFWECSEQTVGLVDDQYACDGITCCSDLYLGPDVPVLWFDMHARDMCTQQETAFEHGPVIQCSWSYPPEWCEP